MDILYVVVHAVTVAILSFTKNTAMKYVSPVTYEVMVSFSVPLMLIVEHFMLTFCSEEKDLEIIGASIIFLVSFSFPLQILCFGLTGLTQSTVIFTIAGHLARLHIHLYHIHSYFVLD